MLLSLGDQDGCSTFRMFGFNGLLTELALGPVSSVVVLVKKSSTTSCCWPVVSRLTYASFVPAKFRAGKVCSPLASAWVRPLIWVTKAPSLVIRKMWKRAPLGGAMVP